MDRHRRSSEDEQGRWGGGQSALSFFLSHPAKPGAPFLCKDLQESVQRGGVHGPPTPLPSFYLQPDGPALHHTTHQTGTTGMIPLLLLRVISNVSICCQQIPESSLVPDHFFDPGLVFASQPGPRSLSASQPLRAGAPAGTVSRPGAGFFGTSGERGPGQGDCSYTCSPGDVCGELNIAEPTRVCCGTHLFGP